MLVKNFNPTFSNSIIFPPFNSIGKERGIVDVKQFVSQPAVNILENAEHITIEIAAPGLSKDDFLIELEDETLRIRVEKSDGLESKQDEKVIKKGFSFSNFQKVFNMNDDLQREQVVATYEQGILSIILAKKVKVEPKRIEVQ
ncbi:MAG: Hsp20/alpha crystallin family protein [Saprospiraceae bacterium]